jgi:nitronate monooxygenase
VSSWPQTRVARLLGVDYPIVQAPMAGFTTPELVAAVSNAGGLGALGGAILPPDALLEAIAAVRALTDRPFGVNLFAPLDVAEPDEKRTAAVREALSPFRAELGLEPPTRPVEGPPPGLIESQLAVVAEARVPVFSFTFGVPPLDPIRESGAVVLGTATTVAEAVALERAGVDAVVAQGAEAGGHRGTFLGSFDGALVGGLALVPQVVDATSVPVVLAGGLFDGRGIAAALALGAEGVQLGSAFLACPEAATPEAYRQALAGASDDATVITASYSGRPARAVRTRLIEALEAAGQPLPFPLQAAELADIRAAAAEQGVGDLLFLLAGQTAGALRPLSAGELVATLARETQDVLSALGS